MPLTIVPIARRTLAAVALAAGLSVVLVQAQEPAPAGTPYPTRLTPARALAMVDAARRNLAYVPGEVLVKFKNGVGPAAQQRALRAVRSQPLVTDLRWVGEVAVLRDQREMDSTILAAQLREQPEVEYAEPNYLRRFKATPNDPGFASTQWNFTALDMPRAWDINPGGNDTLTVAVIDTGVTTVNQSFTFRTWDGSATRTISVPFDISPDLTAARFEKPFDFVFAANGTPVLDLEGHGTHVSSTIGEDTNNSLAQAGIAYKTKLMPLKACVGYWEVQFVLSDSGFQGFAPLGVGGCPNDAVIAAIRYAADNGAKVINLSLGGIVPSTAEQEALAYAVGKGVFIAIAAGNAFEDGNPEEFPAGFARTLDGAMAVGAVGPSLARSYYSNTGAYVEVAAPGGDFRAGGLSGVIWQASIAPQDSDPETVLFPRFDRYAEVPNQGTSMASPHVAGIAALIMSQGVTKPAAVEALIRQTARDLGPTGRDSEYGFGLVQPRAALFGFGVAR